MMVLRPFDKWRAGEVLPAAAVKDYDERGNIPDLVKNGFLADKPEPEPVKKPTAKQPVKRRTRKKKA